MKRILILPLLICFGGLVFAQYHVVHVKGRILGDGTGKPVETGMVLKENAGLTFESDGSELGLWHPTKGRAVAKVKLGSEGKRFLQALVEPGSKAQAYPAVLPLSSKDSLLAYFKRGAFLLLPETRVQIAHSLYPMLDGERFFVTYLHDSLDATCNARLSNSGDTLQLDAEAMLQVNGKRMDADRLSGFALVYFDAKRKFHHVCAVEFVLPDLDKLEQEVKSIIKLAQEANPESAFDPKTEVLGFFKDFYGQPDQAAFDKWFENLR